MIVCWSGRIKAGQVKETVWAHWNFLPAAAALAGARLTLAVDGISFAHTLTSKGKQTQSEYVYWEFYERGTSQAIRLGHRKAIGGFSQRLNARGRQAFAGHERRQLMITPAAESATQRSDPQVFVATFKE